jgi:phosphoglycolate phosphatase-like HAD superfamily hydrolase
MSSNTQILVFDFDGVICNSIHDSLMTALNTYIQFVPEHTLPLDNPLEPDSLFLFEKNHEPLFNRFSKLMPMGNFAEDYFVFLRIIEKDKSEKVKDQASFNIFKSSIPEEKLNAYQTLFYRYRTHLQESDPESWAYLLPPFPGIVEAIQTLSQRFLCAIATSKDRRSVDILLRSYGLGPYFRPENILDKDFAKSKREHLIQFHKEHDTPFKNIHFIDDKILHLTSVKDLGIRAYLALWGFNTERERRIARENGLTPLLLEDLPQLGKPLP